MQELIDLHTLLLESDADTEQVCGVKHLLRLLN